MNNLELPTFFSKEFTSSWPCMHWNLSSLSEILGTKKLGCRISKKTCARIMETECEHTEITVAQFDRWMNETATADNPLHFFSRSHYACYIDYKYMKDVFEDRQDVFDHVRWADFGLDGFNGYHSTIWIGSEGANTPGHQDSYGFNLVTQIVGRKLWVLFPPDDKEFLYPTRLPYEESSVFSQVNIRNPNLRVHSKFERSSPIVVILQPGETLYVPHHWWHYVESLEPSISVNVWVPHDDDNACRLQEAVTRCMASSFIPELSRMKGDATSKENCSEKQKWLNPTEKLSDVSNSFELMQAASVDLSCGSSCVNHLQEFFDFVQQFSVCRVSHNVLSSNILFKIKPDPDKTSKNHRCQEKSREKIGEKRKITSRKATNQEPVKRKYRVGFYNGQQEERPSKCIEVETKNLNNSSRRVVNETGTVATGKNEILAPQSCPVREYMVFVKALCSANQSHCCVKRADSAISSTPSSTTSSTAASSVVPKCSSPPLQSMLFSHSSMPVTTLTSPDANLEDRAVSDKDDQDPSFSVEKGSVSMKDLTPQEVASCFLASALDPEVIQLMSNKFLDHCNRLLSKKQQYPNQV